MCKFANTEYKKSVLSATNHSENEIENVLYLVLYQIGTILYLLNILYLVYIKLVLYFNSTQWS